MSLPQNKAFLEVKDVSIDYKCRGNFGFFSKKLYRAVDQVSFSMQNGSTMGIVGESGSGKSSLIKSICKLVPISSGEIWIDGQEISQLSQKKFLPFRKKIQMVAQDFCETFNPKMKVEEILSEPIDIHFPNMSHLEKRNKIVSLLESVDLNSQYLSRYPQELSGGQRQRLSIARALSVEPELLICDEIVSACDMRTQKQILSLLKKLNQERGISILFISHNIAVITYLCQEIIVMKNGKIIEQGTTISVCKNPSQAYTQLLLRSVPCL